MPPTKRQNPVNLRQVRERGLHRANLPQDCLKILQVTDTHLYADNKGRLLGVDTLESFKAVIDTFLKTGWQADLVLATGDLVHDATPRGYRQLADLLAHFGVPVYCLPGNHDDPQTMRDNLQGRYVSCPQVADIKGWRLIQLNSVVVGEVGGHLARSELELLEKALSGNARPTLISLHHQPVAVGCDWLDHMGLDNSSDLEKVIDAHPQVKGLLWGHIHQQFDGQRNGIRLMGSPSTCIQFTPDSDDFSVDARQPGFRLLALTPDGQILSEVMRVAQMPQGLEISSAGYD